MRILAFGMILPLAAVVFLDGLALGAGTSKPKPPAPKPPPAQPTYVPQPGLPRPVGYGGNLGVGGIRLPNYRPNGGRPGAGTRMVTVTTNYTVTFNEDAGKVRTMSPPEQFDDKGEIKKPTREELRKLKGDTPAEKKLPGYKAEFTALEVNDTVQVGIAVWKPKSDKARKPAKKKKDEEAADDAVAEAPKVGKDGKWVTVGSLLGTVTRIDGGNTDNKGTKLTIKVQAQVQRPNNAPAGNPNGNITIEPDKAQATLILIARKAPPK
jgi:hypothetical protein